MQFKKIILFIHRWLGFTSGLVVFIMGITGCILCFQDEIQDAVHAWRKVNVEQCAYVAPSVLKGTALKIFPGAQVTFIFYYGRDRPSAALVNVAKKGVVLVYINPYSGKVLHEEALMDNFFTVVQHIHLYLLLPEKVGQWVVGVSVSIFVILLITGIIMWWPKRKSDRKRSFTIKWNSRWRRVNYDLHSVLGFYAVSIALIISLSGLNIAFEPLHTLTYKIVNLGKQYPTEQIIALSDTSGVIPKTTIPVIDQAFLIAQTKSPDAQMFLLYDDGVKKETINITAYQHSLHFGLNDYYYFDRFTGKLIKYLPYTKKSPGMKLNDLNYDIHVGQVYGLPNKILTFLTGLICASLPLTGVIIWFGKRKKPKQRSNAVTPKR